MPSGTAQRVGLSGELSKTRFYLMIFSGIALLHHSFSPDHISIKNIWIDVEHVRKIDVSLALFILLIIQLYTFYSRLSVSSFNSAYGNTKEELDSIKAGLPIIKHSPVKLFSANSPDPLLSLPHLKFPTVWKHFVLSEMIIPLLLSFFALAFTLYDLIKEYGHYLAMVTL